ncbi:hypothetical protein [Paraferrimonas sp. SM1919]|uniref:hypothetical protein n=1 Tax=Paraferrimonas sp. SM1919 TaxID=2662263 RepID=UPI0013D58813|nr:hypothetical protein [Paraferrimonas sp. SM1919]
MKKLIITVFISLLSFQAFGSFDELKWEDEHFTCEEIAYDDSLEEYPRLTSKDRRAAEEYNEFDRRRRLQDAFQTRSYALKDLACTVNIIKKYDEAIANNEFTKEESKAFKKMVDGEIIRKTDNVAIAEKKIVDVKAQIAEGRKNEINWYSDVG